MGPDDLRAAAGLPLRRGPTARRGAAGRWGGAVLIAWALGRRLKVQVALGASVACCAVLRLVAGPGVALPLGPVIAPVWLFATAVAALVCLPVVSTGLTPVERQTVRYDWRFRLGRAAAFLATYGAGLAVLAADDLTAGFAFFALTTAATCLLLAAGTGDQAVVIVLAVMLVAVICSTYEWFTSLVLTIDRQPVLVLAPLGLLVVAVSATTAGWFARADGGATVNP